MCYNWYIDVLSKEWVSLQKNRILKSVISALLFIIILLCFTFNAFGSNIVMSVETPQITIDGRDNESAWMDSNKVVFEAVPEIGGLSTVDMLYYKNIVYGAINFKTHLEDDIDFVLRVDFHYKKNSAYMLFVMREQKVFYGDNKLAMEGMCQETKDGYCAEFSFSTDYSSFAYGDLVKIEVKYGIISEVDNYENVHGFMGSEQYDFYIGGQLIETPSTEKTTRPHSSKKTTAKKETTTKTTKSVDNNTTAYSNPVSLVDANYMNNKETAVIVIVMTIACFIMFIVLFTTRRNDDKGPKYTDDDKGCD